MAPSETVDKKPTTGPTVTFDTLTVVELRAEAKSKGITGISKMKRAELIEALESVPTIRTSPTLYTMVLDTETTGLPDRQPKESYPQYTDLDKFDSARIVQWTWGLYDDTGTPVEIYDYIIKPEGFEIPAESVAFHKITTERAQHEGVPFATAAEKFIECLDQAHVIVGHNIMFDINVIKSELHRREDKAAVRAVDTKGIICTMSNSREVCRLARQTAAGYKNPSLRELYTHMIGEAPDTTRLHNALYDVECTAASFFGLLGRVAPPTPEK